MTDNEELDYVIEGLKEYRAAANEVTARYYHLFIKAQSIEKAIKDWAYKYFGKYIKDKQYDKMYLDFDSFYINGYLTINIEEVLGYMESWDYETFVVPRELIFKDLTKEEIVSCKEE